MAKIVRSAKLLARYFANFRPRPLTAKEKKAIEIAKKREFKAKRDMLVKGGVKVSWVKRRKGKTAKVFDFRRRSR